MRQTMPVVALFVLMAAAASPTAQVRGGGTPGSGAPSGKPTPPPKPPLPPPIPPTALPIDGRANDIKATDQTASKTAPLDGTASAVLASLMIRYEGCLLKNDRGELELRTTESTFAVSGSTELSHHTNQYVQVRGSVIAAPLIARPDAPPRRFAVSEIEMIRATCERPAEPAPNPPESRK